MVDSAMPVPLEMNDQMTRANPTLDYTTPDLISLIISDLGVLTPSVRPSNSFLGSYVHLSRSLSRRASRTRS